MRVITKKFAAVLVAAIIMMSALTGVAAANDVVYLRKNNVKVDTFSRENAGLVISECNNVELSNLQIKGTGQLIIANSKNVTVTNSVVEGGIIVIGTENVSIDSSVTSKAALQVVNQNQRTATSGLIDISNMAKDIAANDYVARSIRQVGAKDFSALEIKCDKELNQGKFITTFHEDDNVYSEGSSAVTHYYTNDYKGGVEKAPFDVIKTEYGLVKDLGKYKETYNIYKIGDHEKDIDPLLLGLKDITTMVVGNGKLTLSDVIQNREYYPAPVLCKEDKTEIKELEVKEREVYKVRLKFELPLDFTVNGNKETITVYSQPITVNVNAMTDKSDPSRVMLRQVLQDPVIANGTSSFSMFSYEAPIGWTLDQIIMDKQNLKVHLNPGNSFGVSFIDPDKEVFTTTASLVFINKEGKKKQFDAYFTIKFTASKQTLINAPKDPIEITVNSEGAVGLEMNKNEKDKFISAVTSVDGITVDENGVIKSTVAYEGNVGIVFAYTSADTGKNYTTQNTVFVRAKQGEQTAQTQDTADTQLDSNQQDQEIG